MINQLLFRLKLRPCSPDDVLSTAELIQDFYEFEMRHEYGDYYGSMMEMTATHTGHNSKPVGMPDMNSLQIDFELLQSYLIRVLHYSCDVTIELSELSDSTHKTVSCGGTVLGQMNPPKTRKGRVVIKDSTDLF